MRDRGCAGMNRRLCRRRLFLGAKRPGLPLAVPGWQIFIRGQAREIISGVDVGLWVCERRIVHIPALLSPRIKDDFFPGVVRMKRGDHALGGVIEEDRAHADADVGLEAMRVGKKWFELSDGFAFVIEYCPTT